MYFLDDTYTKHPLNRSGKFILWKEITIIQLKGNIYTQLLFLLFLCV